MVRKRYANQGPSPLHQNYREDGRARQGRVHNPRQRHAPQATAPTPAVPSQQRGTHQPVHELHRRTIRCVPRL